jgi:hypothetical protein
MSNPLEELTVILTTTWYGKIREISVSKLASLRFDVESSDLRKLDIEVKAKYQVEISNRFAASENLDDSLDINVVWKSIRENIMTSAKENLGYHRLKHNKPWFDECSKLTDQQKQANLQWLQNPRRISEDNMQTLRCESSRTF